MRVNNRKFKVKVKTYLLNGGVQFLVKKVEIKGDQFIFGIKRDECIDDAVTCSNLMEFMKDCVGFEKGDKIEIKHENYNIIREVT